MLSVEPFVLSADLEKSKVMVSPLHKAVVLACPPVPLQIISPAVLYYSTPHTEKRTVYHRIQDLHCWYNIPVFLSTERDHCESQIH